MFVFCFTVHQFLVDSKNLFVFFFKFESITIKRFIKIQNTAFFPNNLRMTVTQNEKQFH